MAFWIDRSDGHVLLEKCPEKGLLGGMIGFPGTVWGADMPSAEDAVAAWQALERQALAWDVQPGVVKHTFTHFHLELQVIRFTSSHAHAGVWCAPDALDGQALPSVMKKVAAHALYL